MLVAFRRLLAACMWIVTVGLASFVLDKGAFIVAL